MIDTHVDELANHPRRLIALEAVHNFRDLGGYPAAGGRTTKWRTLFRSDGLYRLRGANDMSRVMQLGLKSVIDLRTEREQREQGIFPIDDIEVNFHHLSIVDVTWSDTETPEFDDEVEFLVWGYRDMLEIGSSRFADAMHVLAQTESLPAVFHCAAGKDRTGVLAALLLSSLGVEDAHICADYGLTQDAMQRTIAWSKVHRPELAERYATIPKAFLAADPRAMQIILAELAQQHGSVRNYVREIGVADATVEVLGNLLLESR
ncbi:MAG: tyrosine-protein phosphatase [Ilumatobacteraceae bacterium]|nr:tyrosine-protein phosphatase [Ilumatobacteraceae bacterium]